MKESAAASKELSLDGLPVTFLVPDDSMDDNSKKAICTGDLLYSTLISIIGCKMLLQCGKSPDCVVVYGEKAVICRVNMFDAANNCIRCSLSNPDKVTYPDFSIPLSETRAIYQVYKVLRTW